MRRFALASLGAAGLFGAPRTALACGGCFSNGASAPVVAHRMAFALSEGRTVLWDQFQYSGPAEEFAWVLPITPGAYLELSSDAWFDALETVTAVRVAPPVLNCASRSDTGCSRGEDVLTADSSSDRGAGVTVLRRESVGPYDVVTLRSESGDALTGWLLQNSFVVPADVAPIIAEYVNEGADFIALKLRPTASVRQMQPVRVITPDGPPILPLRMVAAGAAESVDIVLYVIGDQRFHMPDFSEVVVDIGPLSYDFADASTNYLELRQQALSFNGGQTFLTAYARQGFFSEPRPLNPIVAPPEFIGTYLNLSYQESGIRNRQQCGALRGGAASNDLVVPDCAPMQESGCTPPGEGELAFSELVCEEFEDIAVALLGQRPQQTWLTRLELRVPRSALTADCLLLPSPEQAEVNNLLTAPHFANPPCDLPVFSSSLSPGRPRALGAGLFAALFAGALLRRAARRRA
jgi:hypothetical protein